MGEWRGFSVGGRRVLVVGAAAGTLGTVSALLHAGASVRVVAEDATDSVADLAARGQLELVRDGWQPQHLQGVALVVTDGADPDRDRRVESAAAERNVLCCPLHPVARPRRREAVGEVVLVGGGPGDPGLLTVAGQEAIRTADVIATDRLAPLPALAQAREDAEVVDVGKIPRGAGTPQQAINELLIDRARAGARVVRFKGGDGFVFGRGGEEWQACVAAGVPVRLIPGVTSATAAPAAAGIPVTHRSLSQGFTVVSGHLAPDDPRTMIDWRSLATAGSTLVILMGMANLEAIAAYLVDAGMPADTPAAAVVDGTLPSMRTVRAQLDTIAERCRADGLGAPATVVIGAVAGFAIETS